jgi:hypothetical protein
MQCVFGISHDILDLNRAPLEHGAAGNRAAVDGQRMIREEVDIGLSVADSGSRPIFVAYAAHDEGHIRIAELRG